ncbi:MAG: SUMF1/EgtB/PvdO family nonheme iron enzyme [Polyangiaceae bacterium]|nr:SUMF1/EgtB/PvdO family nonheme iron enzyme [Polyangiaceae bacterium]
MKISLHFCALFVAGCTAAPEPQTAALPKPTPAPTTPAPATEPVAAAPVEVAPPPAPPASTPDQPTHGPSCDGRAGAGNDCGAGQHCCARALVPSGDVLYRRLDSGPGEKKLVRAFYLDKFEATVGRFRAWVAAGQPVPKPGQVLHDDGEGHQLKWPQNGKVQDAAHLEGWKRYDTWTGGDDHRPKNNITWYTAAAFCAWDGGRLPTDIEWTRASRGGEEDRPYPWGTEAPSPEHAVYNCLGDGDKACALVDILPVGSKSKGVGRWGHFDLAGSMFEWTTSPGKMAGADPTEKARGGGFCYIGGVDRRASTELRPAVFREDSPDTVSHMTGVRCAFDAPAGDTKPSPQGVSGGSASHAK